MQRVRRAAAVWFVLFAAYAATIGLHAFGSSQFGGDEPHYLLTAESIVSDHDVDLRDEYAARAYREWYPYVLERHGRLTNGQANEPHGIGFPLLIAPAYALGGTLAVQLLMAAIAALAFSLGAALARRVAPEPWASAAALACGLSPPALAYSTTVSPELTAGALLSFAALLALRVRELPRIRWVAGAAIALAYLPWLGLSFALSGAVIAVAMVQWLRRRARGFAVLVTAEVLLFSAVMFVTINDQLFGGFTPTVADVPGSGLDELGAEDIADRAPRMVGLWLDRTYGCAGRPCWRSRSSRCGCCGARAATTSRGRCPSTATSRSPRRCARSSAARRPSSPCSSRRRCSASGFPGATSSPRCRWRSRSSRGDCAMPRAQARCSSR
jgi:hypothetical protein